MKGRAPKTRRVFLKIASAASAGLAAGSGHPPGKTFQGIRTVREAIDSVVRWTVGKPLPDTVDTVKQGNPDAVLKGVTTCFLATVEVIQKSAELGHNLVITHEPIFYNHTDEVSWLEDDPVYRFKKNLIEKAGIVVWRCHDTVHAMKPDPIVAGMERKLDWSRFADPACPGLYHVPKTTLEDLAGFLKKIFGLETLRSIGRPDMTCEKIGLSIGAPGGRHQIQFLKQADPDVLICGELHEWETSEYVRDAGFMGKGKGLLLIGHANSEDSGMEYFSDMLKRVLPGIPIVHLTSGDPFRSL